MRPIQKTINIAAATTNGIVTSTKPENGVDLTLNGSLVSGGVATPTYPTQVSFASTSNLSTVVFTVFGTGTDNNPLAEDIVGPNNATVTGTKTFKTVTRIAVVTASTFSTERVIAGTATVGIGTGAWWPLDIYTPNQVTTMSINLLSTATCTYTTEYTNEDIWNLAASDCLAVAHPVAAIASGSTDQTGFTTTLMRAVRFNVASGSGQVRVTLTQQSTA
jgi:hypothetical protein